MGSSARARSSFLKFLCVLACRPVRGDLVHVDVDRRGLRVLLAKAIHQCPSRDAEQPGPKLGPVTEPRDAANHSDPDILKDLPCRVVVADQATDERPEWSVPARD